MPAGCNITGGGGGVLSTTMLKGGAVICNITGGEGVVYNNATGGKRGRRHLALQERFLKQLETFFFTTAVHLEISYKV